VSATPGEWALGDRVERGVIGRDVGAERLVEALGRERELVAAFRELVLDDVGDDPGRRELGLEVGQVLALVGSETGDVDEADDVVGRAGRGDDGAAVGVTDQQNRPVDLPYHSPGVLTVAAAQTPQRVRRSEDPQVFGEESVVQTAEAGCISERTVHQHHRRPTTTGCCSRHEASFMGVTSWA
jgi:hypothetical protein